MSEETNALHEQHNEKTKWENRLCLVLVAAFILQMGISFLYKPNSSNLGFAFGYAIGAMIALLILMSIVTAGAWLLGKLLKKDWSYTKIATVAAISLSISSILSSLNAFLAMIRR